MKRNNEDKRRAVPAQLDDSEWAKWSDREIGRQCRVAHTFVSALRRPEIAEKQQARRPLVECHSTPACGQVECDSTS